MEKLRSADRRKGTFKSGVLSYGVSSGEPVTMGGMTVAEEVNPVIAELQTRHILVTALHNLGSSSCTSGAVRSPESVGGGIAAALKHVSTK